MSTTDSRTQELQTKNATACPVVQAMDRVGTQWRLHILYALQGSELRFNEIKRATGARSKTLSEALEALAEEDLVTRRTEAAAPIAVYYQLSEKGESLIDRLDEIGQWAVEWIDDVDDPDERRPRLQ
jgi:DNA-binding HxlR family transcriptional regulator